MRRLYFNRVFHFLGKTYLTRLIFDPSLRAIFFFIWNDVSASKIKIVKRICIVVGRQMKSQLTSQRSMTQALFPFSEWRADGIVKKKNIVTRSVSTRPFDFWLLFAHLPHKEARICESAVLSNSCSDKQFCMKTQLANNKLNKRPAVVYFSKVFFLKFDLKMLFLRFFLAFLFF